MSRAYDPSLYRDRPELKAAMLAVKVTHVQAAAALAEPPSTTTSRLNGYAPLYGHQEQAILALVEKKKQEQEHPL